MIFIQGTPGPQIRPSKISGKHIYVVCLFHDPIIDGDIGTFGIGFVNEEAFIGRVDNFLTAFKQGIYIRKIFFEGMLDGWCRPYKDSGVPVKFTGIHEYLRHSTVWFLRKGLYLVKIVEMVEFHFFIYLNIAITGLRSGRLYS